MEKKAIAILIVFVFAFNLFFVNSKNIEQTENKELNNSKIRVIFKLREPLKEDPLTKKQKSYRELENEKLMIKNSVISQTKKENIKHIFGDYLALEIPDQELDSFYSNTNIESIRIDRPFSLSLIDSVPLVNGTETWPLQFLGVNLTGAGETICIIDTGIDFSHPDLLGKNLTCNIDCLGKPCIENCSVTDDSGHGTHVAGIAAASGILKGVSIGAKLIGVKVLDSTGSGTESDVVAGMDWCIENANTYNISVISMSLGTRCDLGYCYNYYCDNVPEEQLLSSRVNNATPRNISVVVATGNEYNYTHISSPACIKNSTAVGATDKNDNLAYYSNRNNLTDLVAPGSSINSTMISNPGGSLLYPCGTGKSYCVLSGTSMATPHVAGAFAIVNQFFKLQNKKPPTFLEIQNALNSTGKIIYDSQSGLNFSRIDIYSSILSLDTTPPDITLTYPANNTINTTTNQTFFCNASDLQLSGLTFYIWNSTGSLVYNETRNLSGTNNESSFNVNLSYNIYLWNCRAFDLKNYSAFAISNYTITIRYLYVNLTYPENNLATNRNQSYNCTFVSENTKSLKNSTLYIWNSTGSLVYNETRNLSGVYNSSLFHYNFSSDGNYTWNCGVFNNNSESAFGTSNFSIQYDITSPNIDFLQSLTTSTTTEINFTTNEPTNSSIIYGTDPNNLCFKFDNSTFSLNHSVFLTGLFSSTIYYYDITVCDSADNCVTNGTKSFTTSQATSIISGASSGGLGGGEVTNISLVLKSSTSEKNKSYILKIGDLLNGYTNEFKENDIIIFVFSEDNLRKDLFLKKIRENYAEFVLDSITLNISIGEIKKLDLRQDNHELNIELENITNKKAKISLKLIYKLPETKETQNTVSETNLPSERSLDFLQTQAFYKGFYFYLTTFLVSLLILFAIMIRRYYNKKKKKRKILKEYRGIFYNYIKPKTINKIRR